MATVIRKAKLGVEDVQMDVDGSGATMSVQKSDGTFRTVRRLNASHIPITTACRAKKQASGAAIGTTDIDATLVQALDDLEDLGQPDESTLTNDAGALKIKDLGVATGKIAASAVTYAKIQNVTAKRLLGNNTASSAAPVEIAADDSTVEIATGGNLQVKDGGIGATQLGTDSVVTAKIKNGEVTAAKFAWTQTHYVLAAGTVTITGTATSGTATVSGATTADLVITTIKSTTGGAASYVKTALVSGSDTVTITLSAAPAGGDSSTIQFVVLRAN